MKTAALLFLALLIPAASHAEAPVPGQVTLSWDKFSEFWQKMQKMEEQIDDLTNGQDAPPPVPFTLTEAAYQGAIRKGLARIDAIMAVDVYEKKGWVKVPFLPSDVAVESVKVDERPAGIVEEDGFHVALLSKPGRHVLRVRFSLKAPGADEAPNLSIPVPTTPLTVVALRFADPRLDVTLEPAQGARIEHSAEGTLVTAALPPTDSIEVSWQKSLPAAAALPRKMYADMETLLTASESNLKARWTVNMNVLHQGAQTLRLAVPQGWSVLNVSAEGLQEWTLEEGPSTVVNLRFAYPKKGAFQLVVEGERGYAEKEDVVPVAALRALDVERETGLVAVEARGAVEIDVPETHDLRPMDPQELPQSVWQAASQPLLFAFRHNKPYGLSLSVKRHAEVPLLTTTVDTANGFTLFTARGQSVTRVQYQVRNHLKQYLSLELPRGADLWSAFVAGQPVKPTQLDNGVYRIPLAKSQEQEGSQGFMVEVIYYMEAPRMAWAGLGRAQFPVPDAPVSRAMWSVYLPEQARIMGFGGDMEKGAMASGFSPILRNSVVSRRDFVDMKSRKVQLLEADVDELNERVLAGAAPASVNKPHWESRQKELMGKSMDGTGQRAGALPLAFEIPASGQLFNFGQVMIINKSPKLTWFYMSAGLWNAILLALFGLLFALVYRDRERLLKLARQAAAVAARHWPAKWRPSTAI